VTTDIRDLIVKSIVDRAIDRVLPEGTPPEHECVVRQLVTAKMVQHDLEQQLSPEGIQSLRMLLSIINLQAKEKLAVSDEQWLTYGQASIDAAGIILEAI